MSDLGPAPTVFDNVDMNREDLNSNEAHEEVEDDSSSLLVNHLPLFDNSVLQHFLCECRTMSNSF